VNAPAPQKPKPSTESGLGCTFEEAIPFLLKSPRAEDRVIAARILARRSAESKDSL